MNNKRNTLLGILFILFVLGVVGFEIYVWVTYADKPIDEIPLWALWFLFGGNRK